MGTVPETDVLVVTHKRNMQQPSHISTLHPLVCLRLLNLVTMVKNSQNVPKLLKTNLLNSVIPCSQIENHAAKIAPLFRKSGSFMKHFVPGDFTGAFSCVQGARFRCENVPGTVEVTNAIKRNY